MNKVLDWLANWLGNLTLAIFIKRDLFVLAQVLVALGLIGYFIYVVVTDSESTPCSPDRYPARCYNISQSQCEMIWRSAEVSCLQKVQRLSLPPTRLVGPIVFRCQEASLDSAFSSLRLTNSECNGLNKELREWKKRNTDF